MVGKYALICAMEMQKIHKVVQIFSGFALHCKNWSVMVTILKGYNQLQKVILT